MFDELTQLFADLPDWFEQLLLAAAAALSGVAVGLAAHALLFRLLQGVVARSHSAAEDIVVRRLARPSRYGMIALGIALAAREEPMLQEGWQRIDGFLMPALIGWIALALLQAMIETMYLNADISVADNRNARRRRTRLAILGRIATFVIVFITIALMLFTIPGVRQVGITLMASAGVAALAIGAAAQPALKALIAGFQMALTEPISIDDVVILDGESGRIEDIRTTYVVVRLWDQRRLVVPTTRFLEDTFQNLTKRDSAILSTVMLYLDPGADIDPIRAEFERQIRANLRWDGRTQAAQVTDVRENALHLRLLVSAKDGSTAFDLCCEIREGMLAWIRDNQPDAFVHRRGLAPVVGGEAPVG